MSHSAWSTPLIALFRIGPVLPVRAVVHGLPGVLDPIGRFAKQKGLQILLDCGLHQVGALGESGAAVAVKAVLIRGDFHNGQARARRRALDDGDILDLWRSCAAGRMSDCGLCLGVQDGPGERNQAGRPQGLEETATLHE